MLAYHPALDAYHTAFRMLRVLLADSTAEYEFDKLRILDFYLAFPSLIAQIRVPHGAVRRKNRTAEKANRYKFNGQSQLVFSQMRPLQEKAVQLLTSAGIVNHDDYLNGRIRLLGVTVPSDLEELLAQCNARDSELITFIVSDLGQLNLVGKDGLKDRTALMEFRYDSV